MSGQIVPLFPGSRQVVRPDEEQRVAELEANVAIARDAAMRAWMAAREVPHPGIDPNVLISRPMLQRWQDEAREFAAWWDGTP